MAGIRDSLGRVGYDLLSRALADCAREGITGGLRAEGLPGGVFHLRNGLVVAVESPGAPGAEALLLRSGRAGAGAAELRVVRMMAMQDAVFAVVAGRVDGCERIDGAEPRAPVAVGEAPARLLQEAARKLTALAALPSPVRPDRARPLPALEVDLSQLGAVRRELLLNADGRRTARDIAFRTGRGVYTVTVEMARMLGEGLLECPERVAPALAIPVRIPAEGLKPRTSPPVTPPATETPPPAPDIPVGPAPALPRRRPAASGISQSLAPEKHGASWRGFFRLRSGTAK